MLSCLWDGAYKRTKYGVRHMVKDHSDSERGNMLPPHGLLVPINSKGSFICTIPDRIVTPVVEHWLKREIAQLVHPMKDRSNNPSHHERTLLPWSYISLPTDGVITPNKIPLTTIVTYLQKRYRSRISNHWATIPACSVVPPIYKQSKKTYCHISF